MGLLQILPLWVSSGPGSNGNKGVLHIPQNFKTGALQSVNVIFRTLIGESLDFQVAKMLVNIHTKQNRTIVELTNFLILIF